MLKIIGLIMATICSGLTYITFGVSSPRAWIIVMAFMIGSTLYWNDWGDE